MNDSLSRQSTNYNFHSSDSCKNEFLNYISSLLQEIIDEHHDLNYVNPPLFFSKIIPKISIQNYLQRIVKYTKLETSTLILMLIYIDRISESNSIQITKNNAHRLLLSSSIISIKVNEDEYFSNSFYAKVGGISLQEVNFLEKEFLKLIKYRLWIDQNLYDKYKIILLNYDRL